MKTSCFFDDNPENVIMMSKVLEISGVAIMETGLSSYPKLRSNWQVALSKCQYQLEKVR